MEFKIMLFGHTLSFRGWYHVRLQRRGLLTHTNVVVVARVRRMVIIIVTTVYVYIYRDVMWLPNPFVLLGLPPNTPPQVEASPISVICLLCFGRARALVSTSAVCSGSRQFSIVTRFCSMSSLTQCHRIAMCLLRLWNCWFLAIEIEPSLSPLISVWDVLGDIRAHQKGFEANMLRVPPRIRQHILPE